MRSRLLLWLFLSSITTVLAASPQSSPCGGKLTASQIVSGYLVSLYESQEEGFSSCYEVRRDGRVVFSREEDALLGFGNEIAGADSSHRSVSIPIGADITGLGKPNVLVHSWSGGAHCCFTFHVLELGDPVREVAAVDASESDYAHFEDIDHDGRYEFVGWDFTFAYWHECYLDSPAPVIVLTFDGGSYRLALKLMHKTPPSTARLHKLARTIRSANWRENFPPTNLWKNLLDLIYSGNATAADVLLHDAWKPGALPEKAFRQQFCDQLSTSPYATDLALIMKNFSCTFSVKQGALNP
jgi:hypothetical protein